MRRSAKDRLLERAAAAFAKDWPDMHKGPGSEYGHPRTLKPRQLARLLNSTPLGTAITERQLTGHRTAAGYRIGDDKTVDLFRYTAWLFDRRHAPTVPEADKGKLVEAFSYGDKRERERARNAAASASGRDIAAQLRSLPAVEDPNRRARAIRDFQFFCEAYFANAFCLAWSPDHIKVIKKIERAVLEGGLFAEAMPRGSGKTTMAMVACIWAVLCGHRRFVVLIGASSQRARQLLEDIKTWLETNPLLLADFRNEIHGVLALERIANRQAGQTCDGRPTRIEWNADKIVMPTIAAAEGHAINAAGSICSGAVLTCAGMKGSDIRGQKHVLPDGSVIRPDLAFADDPQTRESAMSELQCNERESILSGDVLGMAGPGKKIAALMACTVIREGDMAHRMLDRAKHPRWQGHVAKMVYKFPANEKLWDEYREILDEELRNDGDGSRATAFYRKHRKPMDKGAIVGWPQRHNDDELSAIQHAMNLMFRDEHAFWAEMQNEPLAEKADDEQQLDVDSLLKRNNGLARFLVPTYATRVVSFIDCQQKMLFYVVAAWSDDFTGSIVHYGTWPDQKRRVFSLRGAKHTLAQRYPDAGEEAQIYRGLEDLTAELLEREWRREDGAELRIERLLVDANWQSDTVYQFIRESKSSVILPSHGRGVGAAAVPFSEYKKRPGDRVGKHWRVPNIVGKRAIRHVLFDTNFWKSFAAARLLASPGDRGALTFFGGKSSSMHRLLAEHATAEFRVKTQGRGREVDEWSVRPGRSDNHWWDGVVGVCVAGSEQGSALLGQEPVLGKQRQKRVITAETIAAMRR